MNAVAKLEVFGDQLGSPHTSQVKGSRAGIRELRPRSGRSPWRALYRRLGDGLVVLAIGPEAQHDKRGFDRAVRLAEGLAEGDRGMARRLISNDQVLAGMLQDPEFRAEWERTAVARAVAEAVIRYRAEHKLTQTGLARLLGWSQPVVARLEAAEHNPTMDTLVALSRTLGLRVHVDVGPKTGVVAKVTKSRAA